MDRKSFIKKYIAIFFMAIIGVTILSVMVKYSVEGETNMPFKISKIMVISTAGGIEKENSTNKWDLNVLQSNDIYIDIIKNKNYSEEEIIDKIIINNFKIESKPVKGNVEIYRPSNSKVIFKNKEEYKIDNELIYIGDQASNLEELKIANQGGLILLKCVNENLGNYISDEDEIKHDGTLLGKIGISNEEIKFNISFDIRLELKSGKKYKAEVKAKIPSGNLIQEGTTDYQINGDEIIFKR